MSWRFDLLGIVTSSGFKYEAIAEVLKLYREVIETTIVNRVLDCPRTDVINYFKIKTNSEY